MKRFAGLTATIITAVFTLAACSKENNEGRITFDPPAVYLASAGAVATIDFSTRNITLLSASEEPDGWEEPQIDMATATITVTAPSTEAIESGEAVRAGTFKILGTTTGGLGISASFFVGIVAQSDLTGEAANSFVVSEAETNYLIDVTHRPDGSALSTDHVAVVWQSRADLVEYLQFFDGKASFFIGADDENDEKIKQGNALLGAYNANDELLWSWHIWAVDFDPEADAVTLANGYAIMDRNLGALNNANDTPEEILASYGLYYQWGRKEPFIGPGTYRGGDNGAGAALYDGSGTRVYVEMVDADASTGTAQYALQHPLTFINGVEGSRYDWLWSTSATPLWRVPKTINDPCPQGWQVPADDVLAALTIVDDLGTGYEAYENKYGWTLTDGTASSLFIGAGRRRYDNGKIFNIYNPLPASRVAMEAQPWEGLYWTTGTDAAQATAFYFWFDKSDVARSGVDATVPYARANGMQIRCVQERWR